MTRPLITTFDAIDGVQITREMNDTEFAQYEIDKAFFEQEKSVRAAEQAEEDAKMAAKKAAKEEALAALGLSQEVINLLAD